MKIAIADDEKIYIQLLKDKLSLLGYANIIFEAVNGQELLRKLQKQVPHLIFIDIAMPEINGISAAQLISETHPDIILICYSYYRIPEQVEKMKAVGVKGYILKDSDEVEIERAINSALTGIFYLDKNLAPEKQKTQDPHEIPECSEREMELLNLMFNDFDVPEIADKFNVSSSVVYKMRKRFMDNHKIKTFAGLMRWGILNGMIKIQMPSN